MKRFDPAEAAAVVEQLARERTLLAFDFDGTLAPIVDDRSRAAMRDETRALLRATALLYPCAVISGRTRADVAARVVDVPLVAIVGCHGAEPGFGPIDASLERQVASWRDALARSLPAGEIEIEDKRLGLAHHYRRARAPAEAERRALAAAAALEGAVVFGGHAVVNVVPRHAPTKGDAIRALCARLGTRVAVYVGDDRTDEEAFRAEVVAISICVGGAPDSCAAYSVADQRHVDELLRALVAARARQDGLGNRWEGLVRAMARPPPL
jgi:trehalose 6-phosphate phosphatase